MFCHLLKIKSTSCLPVGQNCGIIPFKTTEDEILDALFIDVVLRRVFPEDSIIFVLSAVVLIWGEWFISANDDVLFRFDLYTRTIISVHFSGEHRSDSDGHLDSCLAGLFAIGGISLYFHSNFITLCIIVNLYFVHAKPINSLSTIRLPAESD